jgi:hypothetical protein
MTAREVLHTYQIRRAGYEEGLLKYPAPLYDAVRVLVDGLEQLPPDEEIRVEYRGSDAVFIVARTNAEIARLPMPA